MTHGVTRGGLRGRRRHSGQPARRPGTAATGTRRPARPAPGAARRPGQPRLPARPGDRAAAARRKHRPGNPRRRRRRRPPASARRRAPRRRARRPATAAPPATGSGSRRRPGQRRQPHEPGTSGNPHERRHERRSPRAAAARQPVRRPAPAPRLARAATTGTGTPPAAPRAATGRHPPARERSRQPRQHGTGTGTGARHPRRGNRAPASPASTPVGTGTARRHRLPGTGTPRHRHRHGTGTPGTGIPDRRRTPERLHSDLGLQHLNSAPSTRSAAHSRVVLLGPRVGARYRRRRRAPRRGATGVFAAPLAPRLAALARTLRHPAPERAGQPPARTPHANGAAAGHVGPERATKSERDRALRARDPGVRLARARRLARPGGDRRCAAPALGSARRARQAGQSSPRSAPRRSPTH